MIWNILTIVGVLVTVGFGVYTIWIYRKNKRNVSIEFKVEQCYNLFRDDVSRLDIEVTYKKRTFSNSLILLKAKITNNGQVDIDKNRIYKPVKLISPKEFHWIEAKLISSPENSSILIDPINSNKIEFNWELLKSGESIVFESLIEAKENVDIDTFYDNITFDFRITDLNFIAKENKNKKEIPLKLFRIYIYIIIIMGAYQFTTSFYPNLPISLISKEIIYNIETNDKNIQSLIAVDRHNSVMLRCNQTREKEVFSISEFNEKYKIKNIVKIGAKEKEVLFNRTTGILFVIFGIIILVLDFLRNRLRKKRKSLLNGSDENIKSFLMR
jgi:Ca2+/Na+ antiporter